MTCKGIAIQTGFRIRGRVCVRVSESSPVSHSALIAIHSDSPALSVPCSQVRVYVCTLPCHAFEVPSSDMTGMFASPAFQML